VSSPFFLVVFCKVKFVNVIHCRFVQTVNGWTDNEVCHQWFEKTFIPHAKGRNQSGKPILLVSDGHQSHETCEMHQLAFVNNIILLSLPPHCTHKLQPLDVGVFGPFQKAWVKICEDWAIENDPVTRFNVVERYMQVNSYSILFVSLIFIDGWNQ